MSENVKITGQAAGEGTGTGTASGGRPAGSGSAEHETGMKKGHVLDLKLPIGWLLSAYGVLLLVWGLLTRGQEIYAKSLGFNVNLIWGVIMIIVGGAFLLTAFLKRKNGVGPN